MENITAKIIDAYGPTKILDKSKTLKLDKIKFFFYVEKANFNNCYIKKLINYTKYLSIKF